MLKVLILTSVQNGSMTFEWHSPPTIATYLGTASEALDIYMSNAGAIRNGDLFVAEVLSIDALRLMSIMRILLSAQCPLRGKLTQTELPAPTPRGENWLDTNPAGVRNVDRGVVLWDWRGTSTPSVGVVTLDNGHAGSGQFLRWQP